MLGRECRQAGCQVTLMQAGAVVACSLHASGAFLGKVSLQLPEEQANVQAAIFKPQTYTASCYKPPSQLKRNLL
jgi:hypothetical protein